MKLTIRVVTPVLIRDSRECHWFEFFRRGSYMSFVDIDATLSRLDTSEIREFNSIVRDYLGMKELGIKTVERRNRDLAHTQEDLNRLFAKLDGEGRLAEVLPEINIGTGDPPFSKTPDADVPVHAGSDGKHGATVYIRGSSLKGLFETALFYSVTRGTYRRDRIDPLLTVRKAQMNFLYKMTSFIQFSDFIPEKKPELKFYLMKRRGRGGSELTGNGVFISGGEFTGDFSLRKEPLLAISRNSDNFVSGMRTLFGDFHVPESTDDVNYLEGAIVDHMLRSSEEFLSEISRKFKDSGRDITLEACNGTIGGFRGNLFINAERTMGKVPKTYWYIEENGKKKMPGQIYITRVRADA